MARDPAWKPPPPRWETTQVQSRAGDNVRSRPLGDATRWGAGYETILTTANGALQTEQLLRVQVEDNKPRQWQMAGTLALPISMWPGGAGPGVVQVLMLVTMGSGQKQFTHRIKLRELTVVALNSTVYQGLQYNLQEERPWIMGGGLTGLQLSVALTLTWLLLPSPTTVRWSGSIAPITAV